MVLHTQSITDPAPRTGGAYRILVEAAWPEGIPPGSVRLDRWIPELAPSDWLATHFGADPARWGTFRSRYRRQLRSQKRRHLLDEIAEIARHRDVLLLHASADERRNTAVIIREAVYERYAYLLRPRPA